jgi:hypothetical protein
VSADSADREYLQDIPAQFRALKSLADAALQRVSDDQFFHALDRESNSLALIVKHLAGNMRSRWTDMLTSDGEKPDRVRDREFVAEPSDTRDALMEAWHDGWTRAFRGIDALDAGDLTRTVLIRAEPHSVIRAIDRQLAHAAYHVGQIVFLAKHLTSATWTSLTIARGQSSAANDESAQRFGKTTR